MWHRYFPFFAKSRNCFSFMPVLVFLPARLRANSAPMNRCCFLLTLGITHLCIVVLTPDQGLLLLAGVAHNLRTGTNGHTTRGAIPEGDPASWTNHGFTSRRRP